MTYTPNLLSQRDPRWADEKLGFDPTVTIGSGGDALTCLAMLVDGFGFHESPASLNEKLKVLGKGVGFVQSLIVWPGLASAFPGILYRRAIICRDSNAPIADINASLDAGQPLLVEIDRSPVPTLQNHWVLVYARTPEDYLILDPYPWPPDTSLIGLLERYGDERDPAEFITTVVWYEALVVPAPVPTPTPVGLSTPGAAASTEFSQDFCVRVVESVGQVGLRLRDQAAAEAATLSILPAGDSLTVLDAPDQAAARIGRTGEWIQVRNRIGLSGYVAAWLVERSSDEPVPVRVSFSGPAAAAATMTVIVSSSASQGLRLRDGPDRTARILKILHPGTPLGLIEPAAAAEEKIGVSNQWLNVREPGGATGFVAARYVVR
jgi:hypothetical protein